MNGRWREQPNPTMMMLMVVPLKEAACPRPRIGQAAELRGEAWSVFQRLKLRFRIRIVVRDVRPRMGLAHAQIRQQLRHALGRHRTAAIGVQRELIGTHAFSGAGFGDERLGQLSRLALGDHPTDHIAAEHVQNHVQIVVGPRRAAFELGNVPAPQLSGPRGEQLWLGIGRAPHLLAPLAHFVRCRQDAVHGAPRAEVNLFVEQGRIHLAHRAILKAWTIEHVTHGGALLGTQGPCRSWAFVRRWRRCCKRLSSTVVARAWRPQHPAGFGNTNGRGQFVHRLHYDRSSERGAGRVAPSSCATFFWTSIISSAWARRESKRAFSWRNWASSSASGSGGGGFGPRGWGASAWSWPAARKRRHLTRWDEYNPSR